MAFANALSFEFRSCFVPESWTQLRANTSFDFCPRTAGVWILAIICKSRIQSNFVGIGEFAVVEPSFAGKFIELGLNLSQFFGLELRQFGKNFSFAHTRILSLRCGYGK